MTSVSSQQRMIRLSIATEADVAQPPVANFVSQNLQRRCVCVRQRRVYVRWILMYVYQKRDVLQHFSASIFRVIPENGFAPTCWIADTCSVILDVNRKSLGSWNRR